MAKKRLDVAALSRGEIRCCLAIVIALPVYYIGSLIVESSSNFFPATSVQLYLNSFSKDFKNQNWSGNASFNWSRDDSEIEWNNYLRRMLKAGHLFYLIGIAVLDWLLKSFVPQQKKWIMLVYAVYLFQHFFSFYALAFAFVANIVFYLSAKVLKSKALVWSLVLGTMWIINIQQVYLFMYASMSHKSTDALGEFVSTMYFMFLRVICFCMDKMNNEGNSKVHLKYDLIDFLSYTFYPSFFFSSMFVPFTSFYLCMGDSVDYSAPKIKKLAILIARIVMSGLLIELVLHLTLTYKIHAYHGYLTPYFSDQALWATLLLKGSLFSCKYIVYYGMGNLVNSCVGMRTSELPRCVALIHTNGEMWRYFDTGIYEFIKSYLYIPLGGRQNQSSFRSVVVQLVPLCASFVFISYWHGMMWSVTLWTAINFLMVVFELFGIGILRNSSTFQHEIMKVSPANQRRLLAVFLAFWQCIMYVNAFFFLSDLESTMAIYSRSMGNKVLFVLSMIGYYCNAQFRMDYIEIKL